MSATLDPGEIRVAIVGIGNCASSLVQGLAHYQNGGANEQIGLMHWDLGGYRPKDISSSPPGTSTGARSARTSARDLRKPNCTAVFCDHVPASA
jgi:myo-inositol-1-phosphate synthase